MNAIIGQISNILSFLMRFCCKICGSYGMGLVLFTLFTKVILFPVNIIIQKNSIKMVKMQPKLDALKIKYIDDKDKLADEQLALYKENHYHSSVSVIPLVFQLILVMGLLGVVYHPINYVMDISGTTVSSLSSWLEEKTGNAAQDNSAQLEIINLLQSGEEPPAGVPAEDIETIKNFGMSFCGFDMGQTPSFKGNYHLLLIPLFAGLSALLMCVVQNRVNILQVTAENWNKIGMTIFLIAFSAYFAAVVPAGVGIYWIFGNLFSIPSMLLLNVVIPPKKHIDMEYLLKVREQKKIKEEKYKKYHKKEAADYKRFCSEKNMQLMFYSESNGFYKYYADIIDYITEHSDIVIHYVTSDPEDNIFNDKREQIRAYYVARDKYLIPLFMKLECDMCVMTMPDLEKYHIKRSRVKNDVEYVYVCHGMGSSALTLRKGALDWYDTMFCVGIDAENEVREMEELYGTHPKTLIEAGYTLIDNMIAQYEASEHKKNDPRKILIAPSWQPDNIIELCVNELLDSLAKGNFEVILRPHPQMVKNSPEKFEVLHKKYDGSNVTIQTDFSSNSTVFEADLLITDWSDIAFEYAFTTKKPVLFIDTPMKIMNPDYGKIKTVPVNISLRNVIGKSISPEEAENALKTADELLCSGELYRESIEKALSEHIFNVGKSRLVYGRYIIRRLCP